MNNTPNLNLILAHALKRAGGDKYDEKIVDDAYAELAKLKNEIKNAVSILKFFDDGCVCEVICKEGPCSRCIAREFIKRNSP